MRGLARRSGRRRLLTGVYGRNILRLLLAVAALHGAVSGAPRDALIALLHLPLAQCVAQREAGHQARGETVE